MNVPIISMQIEGMKYAINVALTAHAALIDTNIREAVAEFCTPEHIDSVIKYQAKIAIDSAIKETVDSFFKYGEGRKYVVAAVREKLELEIKQQKDAHDTN